MERKDAGCHAGNMVAQRTSTSNTKSRPWTLFGCEPAASSGSELVWLCGGGDWRHHTRLMLVNSGCGAVCLNVYLLLRIAEICSYPGECWQTLHPMTYTTSRVSECRIYESYANERRWRTKNFCYTTSTASDMHGLLSKILKNQTDLMKIKNTITKKKHCCTPFGNSSNKLSRQISENLYR